jgi:hypothetical protein
VLARSPPRGKGRWRSSERASAAANDAAAPDPVARANERAASGDPENAERRCEGAENSRAKPRRLGAGGANRRGSRPGEGAAGGVDARGAAELDARDETPREGVEFPHPIETDRAAAM